MVILVLGGAASGKSEFAEGKVLDLGGPRLYLATMENRGEVAQRRIQRHRLLRAQKGFSTIEQPRDLGQVQLKPGQTVLLECVSNLFANEMYRSYPPISGLEAARCCLDGVRSVAKQAQNLVIVSNNVFDDGLDYDPETLDYIKGLGWLNCRLAQEADAVYEVVCGLPQLLKSEGQAHEAGPGSA